MGTAHCAVSTLIRRKGIRGDRCGTMVTRGIPPLTCTPRHPALVAQGIEHRPPEPCAQVRILPRALCDFSLYQGRLAGAMWLSSDLG